jgi:hypothetical protein
MIGLPPIKCQHSGGCSKYVHHVSSIEWVNPKNLPEGGIATLCRDHPPQFQASARMMMIVLTVNENLRGKSPIVSTANKNKSKTAGMRRLNKSGEVVAAVKAKEPRIGSGVWVFFTKSQLISLVKQGDPCYENHWNVSNGFWFLLQGSEGGCKERLVVCGI